MNSVVDLGTSSPTVIHVEDDATWQELVRNELDKLGTIFRDIKQVASLNDISEKLETTSGPIIIVMDLRLEENQTFNYDGYEWLLKKMKGFVHAHASLLIFVLSGNLHEGIVATLQSHGLRDHQIFEKRDWHAGRKSFLAQIQEFVENVDESALRHMADGASGSKMDPHLLHAMAPPSRTSSLAGELNGADQRFPFLVKVLDGDSWGHSRIPELAILGRIADIFVATGTRRSVAALERDAAVICVEYSRPAATYDCHDSVPFVSATAVHQTLTETGDECLIGLVDSGIDVLHPAFLDANGNSRILAIWDQCDPSGPAPSTGFGTVHTATRIREYLEKKCVPLPLSGRDNAHGTHVASIAAGRRTDFFAGGVAPAAKIAVVIPDFAALPGRSLSIAYSNSHILALDFLKSEAARNQLPLVINVSLGLNAGAHDGSSLLEKAFDEITGNGTEPGIVVVKSAGNERNHCGHALIRMARRSREVLSWRSRPSQRLTDSMELWFAASDRLRFRLTDPFSISSNWIGSDEEAADSGSLSNEVAYSMTLVRRVPGNGASRCVITIYAPALGQITPGPWQLEIESTDVRSGEVHAWLERDCHRSTSFITHISEEMTLSIPGTAQCVVSVGSTGSQMPLQLAPYSSFGPTRDGRKKPELSAPGELITAALGGSQMVHTLSGTSQAAPHVSGAIALLFSMRAKQGRPQFDGKQIQTALTQLVKNPNSIWHPGLGYGLLDTEALVREMITSD